MQNKRRYKVRFHLAKGDNYMKWQVFDLKSGVKTYHDPDTTTIIMHDCKLGNHPKTAQKIHEGANKTVCAWVASEDVLVSDHDGATSPSKRLTHYKYNPRKNPHWFTDTMSNADGLTFKTMMTHGRKIYG